LIRPNLGLLQGIRIGLFATVGLPGLLPSVLGLVPRILLVHILHGVLSLLRFNCLLTALRLLILQPLVLLRGDILAHLLVCQGELLLPLSNFPLVAGGITVSLLVLLWV